MGAIFFSPALFTQFNLSRADILITGDVTASFRRHPDFEIVPFRKNFHPQQVEAFSTGVEIIRVSSRILHDFIGDKVVFKNEALLFKGYPDTVILDFKFGSFFSFSYRHFDSSVVRCVFNRVAYEAFNNLFKNIRRYPDR